MSPGMTRSEMARPEGEEVYHIRMRQLFDIIEWVQSCGARLWDTNV